MGWTIKEIKKTKRNACCKAFCIQSIQFQRKKKRKQMIVLIAIIITFVSEKQRTKQTYKTPFNKPYTHKKYFFFFLFCFGIEKLQLYKAIGAMFLYFIVWLDF